MLLQVMQWHNVISGGPRFKIFEGPLVEVLKARVKRHICTSFLGGPGHVHPENFWIYTLWNAISQTLGRDFTEFWWSKTDIVTYQRPWPMFLLYRLRLGAPIWPIEVGGPRVLPVWAHSSYATEVMARFTHEYNFWVLIFPNPNPVYTIRSTDILPIPIGYR
jgi:hypothetical protein